MTFRVKKGRYGWRVSGNGISEGYWLTRSGALKRKSELEGTKTMATKSKKSAKKPVAKSTKKVVAKRGNFNALHEKLISLFKRPNGATLEDTVKAGYKYPAVFALRIAERRGLKVSVVKKEGERTRYVAKGTAKAA